MEQKMNNKFSKLIIIYFIFATSFLAVRNILNFDIPIQIFTVITIIAFLIVKPTEEIIILGFLIPFTSGIQTNPILLCFLIIHLFKNYNSIKLTKGILLPIILIIIEAIGFRFLLQDISEFIIFINIILVCSIILLNKNLQINSIKFIKAFCIGCIICGVIIFLTTLQYLTFNQIITRMYRLGLLKNLNNYKEYTLNLNPNQLGIFFIIDISLLLVLRFNKSIKMFPFLIGLISLIILGLFTLSRAFIITLAIEIFIYFIITINNKRKFFSSLIIICILLVTIFIMFQTQLSKVIDNFSKRLNRDSSMNERDNLFVEYNKVITDSALQLLIGCGKYKYNEKVELPRTSHNVIQEIIVMWGVVGFVIVSIYLIQIYINVKNNLLKEKVKLINFLPIFSLIIISQTSQLFSQNELILLLPIVFLAILLPNQGEKDEK